MSRTDPRLQTNRARTAISRIDLSRPLKCAIADGLIGIGARIFDYGCGRGGDLGRLAAMGYKASGWDPVHRPESKCRRSSVVNLGYVVNVIENVNERCEALRQAWALAEDLLIVSARLSLDGRTLQGNRTFADGRLTSRGTFQKFFEQQELHHWIEQILQVNAVSAAPGIFYIFRDEQARSNFIAARYRRRRATPRLTRSEELFTAHRHHLEPLMQFVSERGRLPLEDELVNARAIIELFGSLRMAFRTVLTVTEDKRWDEIRQERSRDLLVYLALSQFEGRTPFGRLPLSLQRDVKAFFGTYKHACAGADDLLFSLGKPDVVNTACRQSPIGKLMPSALYLHDSALPETSPLLRLYEGCARGYIGRVEGANIIKLHLGEPKVSYLSYPEFDSNPHPPLASALTVHLQTFRVRWMDYTSSGNRPILHRKELFVTPDYPAYRKFARLTRIEEGKGLYRGTSRIGFEAGWNEALARTGLYFRGHRLLAKSGQRSSP